VYPIGYRRSQWKSGLPETLCGSGSRIENTEIIRGYLPQVVNDYDIESIADIGCGDRNWIKTVDLPCRIASYDYMPLLPEVAKLDCVTDVIEPVDLVLCIAVLNHLHPDDAQRAMHNFKASGSKYLLATHSSIDGYVNPFVWLEGVSYKSRTNADWWYSLWRMN
jgi:hypothetical protein